MVSPHPVLPRGGDGECGSPELERRPRIVELVNLLVQVSHDAALGQEAGCPARPVRVGLAQRRYQPPVLKPCNPMTRAQSTSSLGLKPTWPSTLALVGSIESSSIEALDEYVVSP
jgi:hypothetical protein